MKRVVFISGSIGLGHAARDLAIARGLRDLDAAVEIVWLAGEPARRLIEDAGETVLPESDLLDETASAEDTAVGDEAYAIAGALGKHPELLGREATWPTIPSDGARGAAELIDELLRSDGASEARGEKRGELAHVDHHPA